MLIRSISAVRRKPKEVRGRYAFWIAAVFTSLVLTVWVLNFPVQFGDDNLAAVVESEDLSGDRPSATDMLGELRAEIDKLKEVVSATSTATTTLTTVPAGSSSVSTMSTENRTVVRISTTTNAIPE